MNKLNFAFLAICIFLSSCHSFVDDEFPNYAPVPVLNGLLQADSTFKVQVSLTANLKDTAPTYVSNARVVIESSVDTPDTLVYSHEGWYVSSRIVKAGASYTCKAEVKGFNILSASTTVPYPTQVSEVLYNEFASRDQDSREIASFEFSIPNNKSQRQYWQVLLVGVGTHKDFVFETNEFVEYFGDMAEYIYMVAGQDSVLLSEANPLTLFSNKCIVGERYNVKFYLNSGYSHLNKKGIQPVVVLRSVDESYYRYEKQFYIYDMAQYSIIGQSNQKYPLYSNVKNGLGLFTGMSVARKEIDIK